MTSMEERMLDEEIRNIEEWWRSERFTFTKRPYTAKDVAVLRGTIMSKPIAGYVSTKLYNMLRSSFQKGQFNHTFGALDTVQVIQVSIHCLLSFVFVLFDICLLSV
jgi:isocitrate lyase